jgi:hypothetical protein
VSHHERPDTHRTCAPNNAVGTLFGGARTHLGIRPLRAVRAIASAIYLRLADALSDGELRVGGRAVNDIVEGHVAHHPPALCPTVFRTIRPVLRRVGPVGVT